MSPDLQTISSAITVAAPVVGGYMKFVHPHVVHEMKSYREYRESLKYHNIVDDWLIPLQYFFNDCEEQLGYGLSKIINDNDELSDSVNPYVLMNHYYDYFYGTEHGFRHRKPDWPEELDEIAHFYEELNYIITEWRNAGEYMTDHKYKELTYQALYAVRAFSDSVDLLLQDQ